MFLAPLLLTLATKGPQDCCSNCLFPPDGLPVPTEVIRKPALDRYKNYIKIKLIKKKIND